MHFTDYMKSLAKLLYFCYLFIEFPKTSIRYSICFLVSWKVFFRKMSNLCIRSSRNLLRMLVNSKVCVYLPPARQIGRIQLGVERLQHVTKFVGVSSCVAVGAGLAGLLTSLVLYSPDVIKLHAKAVDGGPKAPDRWNFIADVVEKVSPAVVYIEIEGRWVFLTTRYVEWINAYFNYYVKLHY